MGRALLLFFRLLRVLLVLGGLLVGLGVLFLFGLGGRRGSGLALILLRRHGGGRLGASAAHGHVRTEAVDGGLADAFDLVQIVHGLEGTVLLAVFDDGLG